MSRLIKRIRVYNNMDLMSCFAHRQLYTISKSKPNKISHMRCLHGLAKHLPTRGALSKSKLSLQPQVNDGRRCFWGLDVAFNKVDEERVRLAGADRACAEWVLRNGGSVKWTTSSNYLKDYNLLPSTQFESYKIEAIDLTATDVIGLGFEHLENLKHVKTMNLHGCRMIMDDALGHLHFIKETLESLDISRCPNITEKGLAHLLQLKKLKRLTVYDLIEIRNFEATVANLRESMAWCQFNTTDPLHDKTSS